MRKASWILLAVAGAATFLASLASLRVAYSDAGDQFGPGGPTVQELAAGSPEVATALRARRGTAAAFAAAYAVLYLGVVFGSYRRGDVSSWWTLLAGSLALVVLTALRVPILDTRLGVGTAAIHFAITLVGLLLDVRRPRPAA
jgi:hypothetical protein